MRIEVVCPKCQGELELSAPDDKIHEYYEREKQRGFELEDKELGIEAARFAKGFSGEQDAVAWILPKRNLAGAQGIHGLERLYEYAYTFEKLREYGPTGNKILEVGGAFSLITGVFAMSGNELTCVDVQDWNLTLPHVKIVMCDVLRDKLPLPFEHFDWITCLSSIEHFGLGRYDDSPDVDGDLRGMQILRKYLKPSGLMVLTVPVGEAAVVYPAHRIYGKVRLDKLISGFKVLDKRFYIGDMAIVTFKECSEEQAFAVNEGDYAVGCWLLQKGKEPGNII